jgi:phosphate:Na+ symporter
VTEKATLRAAEFAAVESDLARLQDGRPESVESSSLHSNILRELNRAAGDDPAASMILSSKR